jgi:hypothetical protein
VYSRLVASRHIIIMDTYSSELFQTLTFDGSVWRRFRP